MGFKDEIYCDSKVNFRKTGGNGLKGRIKKIFVFVVSFFVLALTEALPSRHVSISKIHHHSKHVVDEKTMNAAIAARQKTKTLEETSSKKPSLKVSVAASPATVSPRGGSGDDDVKYVIHANDVTLMPSYEYAINPFLSHVEQGWKLQMRKEDANQNFISDEVLPMDTSRPHFVDSGEASNTSEEQKAFGNEEKDLGDFFNVIFSPDYGQ